jgi:hypothetical protein
MFDCVFCAFGGFSKAQPKAQPGALLNENRLRKKPKAQGALFGFFQRRMIFASPKAKARPCDGASWPKRGLRELLMNYIIFEPGKPEPMPSGGILRVSFAVGRYRCTMTKDVTAHVTGAIGTLNAQWEPDVPGRLSKAEIAQYRAGRDGFYQRVANIARVRAMVVEE